ncbi:MAG: serine/threonine-protein kinase [Proteobacteria bacterium]|nr:serine/threonine-protein kinase [Pseudomonadota bacterium]
MWKPGSRIGRYTVVGPVGRGDPDGLFDVRDETGHLYALRSPIADLQDNDPSVTQRFHPVAESMRAIIHTNVVALLDVFVDGGYLCFVHERVGGRTLANAIDDGISARKALIITRQILEAASAAHAMGRIHRDLRPRKVLLVAMNGWDLVKVADFGLGMLIDEAVLAFGNASLTGSLPKPAAAYMAPEQVIGRSIDPRTDIYAIGVMLYEMLANRLPFPDSDPELVKQLQLKQPPPRLDDVCRGADWLTPPVLSLVETALRKEREARYPTAAVMAAAVEAAFGSLQHLPPEP